MNHEDIIILLSDIGLKDQEYYNKLLSNKDLKEKKEIFRACMRNEKGTIIHARKVQNTYWESPPGGFEENIGGNGAMGTYKMR